MELYLYQNGEQIGPYTEDEILSMIRRGELEPKDIIWHEGLSEWQTVSALFDFSEPVAAPVNVFRVPEPEVVSDPEDVIEQEQTSEQEVASGPLEASPKTKKGFMIMGWICIVIGALVMYFERSQYFIYGPFFLIAFMLGITVMLKRSMDGILIWVCALTTPLILWLILPMIPSQHPTVTDDSGTEINTQPMDGDEVLLDDADLKTYTELRNRKAEYKKKLQAMSGFKILSAKYTKEENASRMKVPVINIKVQNGTKHQVGKISFRAVLSSPGREQPLIEDTFNYKLKEGVDAGKQAELLLKPNVFGDWGMLEIDSDTNLDITIIDLTGADNKELFGDVIFTAEDEQRLAELEKISKGKK